MFLFALLDALAGAKGPGRLGVGLPDFLARVAAARLDGIVRGVCAVAGPAVGGVEMGCDLFGVVAGTKY